MPLSPVEKSPVVLLQWTAKARNHSSLMELVRRELTQHRILLLEPPTASTSTTEPSATTTTTTTTTTLSMTASQESLEGQAEYDNLVKRRRIRIPGESSAEVVMDHFKRKYRAEFCNTYNRISNRNSRLDAEGLFSVHERCHLVLGLIDRISLSNNPKLLRMLLEEEDLETTSTPATTITAAKKPQKPIDNSMTSLRYLLQKHGWTDAWMAHHVEGPKASVQKNTCYPFWQMVPPYDEIGDYYGPSIAYYFAFVGFLGTWLGRLGVLGLSSFLLRWYRNDTIDEDEVRSLVYN